MDINYQLNVLKEGVSSLMAKSLSDLIRGIRSHSKQLTPYINEQLHIIKKELRSTTRSTKATAIQKLSYLQMLGYDADHAAVDVIEVMSYPLFMHKRMGYLAASQCFTQDTPVVIMATNLIRRDITSSQQYEAGLALSALSQIATPDLARDLAPDLVTLLSASKPYVRKRAVLALYKVFVAFPDALRPAFPKLRERLTDEEPAVVSAAVSVLTELASKNAANYIKLAPALFRILTSNPPNAWLQLKLIKLFGMLCPVEKRLPKRLIEPMTALINTTSNMALLYECINTCTIGLVKHLPIIRLCVQKLRFFIEDRDQNMKYLGLQALNNIMAHHPKVVREHRETVIQCLDDQDESIRLRALDLLSGMVDKRNLADIIEKLLEHLEISQGRYKQTVVEKIIYICSQKSYVNITDFEWYLDVLVRLTRVPGNEKGQQIADQLMDVAVRVEVVRKYAVRECAELLLDPRFYTVGSGIVQVLSAAAWICGEYGDKREALKVVRAFLDQRATQLPGEVQSIFLQNALKVFARVASIASDENADPLAGKAFSKVVGTFDKNLDNFKESEVMEVQERGCFAFQLMQVYKTLGPEATPEVAALFSDPLEPVHPDAARMVSCPEGLDLDAQLVEWPEESEESAEEHFSAPWEVQVQAAAAPQFGTGYHSPGAAVDSRYILQGSAGAEIPPVEQLSLSQKIKVRGNTGRASRGSRTKQGSKHRKAKIKATMALPGGAGAAKKRQQKTGSPVVNKSGLGAVDLGSELTAEEKELLEKKTYAQATPLEDRLVNPSSPAQQPVQEHKRARKGGRRRKKRKPKVVAPVVESQAEPAEETPSSLFQSESLASPYRLVAHKTQEGQVSLQVALSSKQQVSLEQVSFLVLESSVGVSLVSQRPSKPFQVAPRGVTPVQLTLRAQPCACPVRLRASIEGVEFTLEIPPSLWIHPVELPLDQVGALIAQQDESLVTEETAASVGDLKEALREIASQLHVHPVQIDQGSALFYGKSVAGDHVFVFVKQVDPTTLNISIKSSTPGRSAALCAHVQSLFPVKE